MLWSPSAQYIDMQKRQKIGESGGFLRKFAGISVLNPAFVANQGASPGLTRSRFGGFREIPMISHKRIGEMRPFAGRSLAKERWFSQTGHYLLSHATLAGNGAGIVQQMLNRLLTC